ncbi:MAG: DUF5615 family PIN-like protein [Gammaproteobacteria bacterium]
MRILLDESLPRELARELTGHSVRTVVQMGWSGLRNGELLQLAASDFDVLLTADQNLEHQQNLRRVDVGIVVLVAVNNRMGVALILRRQWTVRLGNSTTFSGISTARL